MEPLVLDTSVIINLQACTYGVAVLRALPHVIVVTHNVATELELEPSKTKCGHDFLQELINNKTVCVAEMNASEYQLYVQLITGASSLDDGEAATIAVATCREFIPVIDEKKGRARASELTPDKTPGLSLDIFRHPKVIEALGETNAIEALYLALHIGRMRIPDQNCDEVISLIGIKRAINCISLPNYKNRRKDWERLGFHAQL